MKTPYDAPAPYSRKILSIAPSRTVSENWGRQGGYYGAPDITTRGYESVVIYVRKGLGRPEIIKPVVDLVLSVQKELPKKWPLVPLSYGWGDELKHLGSAFNMGYMNDWKLRERITKAICGLAGEDVEPGPSIITKLFPRTDARSLYTGKVAVKPTDLLVFVDFRDKVFFGEALKGRMGLAARKRTVFAGVAEDFSSCDWAIGSKNVVFVKEDK